MPNKAVLSENGVPHLETNEEVEEYMIRHHYPTEVISAAVGRTLNPMSLENCRGSDALYNALITNRVDYVVMNCATEEEYR